MSQITATVAERTYHGSVPMMLSRMSGPVGLSSSRDKVTEIWSVLAYYYDIEESRNEFLKSTKGITNARQRALVASAFSSYMTQAHNFYRYAIGSDYRSAALLYYYSFLNLAKAKLVTDKPELATSEFVHGLKRKVKTGGLEEISSSLDVPRSATRVGTFGELYQLRFNRPLGSTRSIKLKHLLGYSSDVSHEYGLVFGQKDKASRAKATIFFDQNRKKCWAIVAIHDWGKQARYSSSFVHFSSAFTKVEVGPLTRDVFKIPGTAMPWYSFFQSNREFDFIGSTGINTFACDAELKSAFGDFWQQEVYDPDVSFQIIEPLRHNLQIPFDELTANYVVMHHLSEIVRYRPYELDHLLSNKSKQGWLLQNFIESSPYSFLLYMASWITGTHYYVQPR
jgi:hypothetical protein